MTDLCHGKTGTVNIFLVTLLVLHSSTVFAVEIDIGDLKGSWDTTVSYGTLHRIQSQDSDLIGRANGGTANSVNGDDGNLNFPHGLISQTIKFTTETDIAYKDVGLFFRGSGFKDMSLSPARTPLDPDAERLVSENLNLLDLYGWWNFDVGKMPAEIRVGEQVISWGESTFIQNSINTINPVDVSKLRTPGAELREALLPVGIVFGSLGLSENTSLELYYQYDWEETIIDPPGSYFSTNDFVGDGGTIAVASGAGAIGDAGSTVGLTAGTFATRATNRYARNGGEYGAALRIYIPSLNDTEFGFYHIKYDSRLPIINGVVSPAGIGFSGAKYLISYPEDIKLYGFSFNTEIGTSGWALQGEYSYRQEAPLQIDDVEILLATADSPTLPNQITKGGVLPPFAEVTGFIRRDVSQFQMTASKIFGQTLKADQAVLVGEWAITYIHDMPSKSTLRLESPGTVTTGDPANPVKHPFIESADNFADSTSWGYRIAGRLDYNNALFGAINLQPRFAWQHDVQGISPGPGGNFLEDRRALTLGVKATYQNEWEADLSYTGFYGAGRYNLLNDRDFMAFSIKYSF